MTKEELKLEAIKYLENFNDCANCRNRWGDCADQLDEYCLENGCCFATPKEQDIYLAGAEFGYNKANEWHYVKDGDLPPLNTNVLVIHRWATTPEVGKRIKVFINSSVWVWAMCSDRYRYTSDDENVIAWKEIVLPKESEEK